MSIMNSISDAFGGAQSALSSMGSQIAGYADSAVNAVGDATGINSEKDIAARENKDALKKSLEELDTQMRDLDVEIASYADVDFDADPEAIGRMSDAEGAYKDLEAKKAELTKQLEQAEASTAGGTVKGAQLPGIKAAPAGASINVQAGDHRGADIFGAGIPMGSLTGTLSGTKPNQQIDLIKKQAQTFGGFRF